MSEVVIEGITKPPVKELTTTFGGEKCIIILVSMYV